MATWIEELFEVNINPETIKSRAYRIQQENGSNEPNDSTPGNDSRIEANQSPLSEIKAPRKHQATGEPMGGAREGAGRPPKTKKKSRPQTPKEQIFEDLM